MTRLEQVPLEMNSLLPISTLVLAVSILTDAESTLSVTRVKSNRQYEVDDDPYSPTNPATGSKYKPNGPGTYEQEEYSSLRGSANRLQNPKYPFQDQDYPVGEGANDSNGEYTGLASSVKGTGSDWSQVGLEYDEHEQTDTGNRLRKNRKKNLQQRKRLQKTSSSGSNIRSSLRNKDVKAKSDGYGYGTSEYSKKEPGCCGQPSKFSELMAVVSFLGLTFIVLYLLFQRLTTSTTTTGKEVEVGAGETIKEVIGQFGSFVQSSLSDLKCTPYKLCELGKISSLMSSVDVPLMSRSSDAWVQGRMGLDCNALYPQCR